MLELIAYRSSRYAFLFYDVRQPMTQYCIHFPNIGQRASDRIYFGRDPLGRRSLLIHYPNESNPYFLLASVSAGSDTGYALEEISTGHIYSLDVQRVASIDNVRDCRPFLHDIAALTLYQILELRSCITPVSRTISVNLPFVRGLPSITRIFGIEPKDGCL